MPIPAGPQADDAEEREVIALLSDPATYPGSVSSVDVIETHIARVFLAGDDAYKVKKRVRLPFVDFTTLPQRHRAVARELEINRPHAPAIYLDLVPIVRKPDGRLRLGGSGEAVDWAVHMRRFDQEALLDRQIRKGPLSEALAKALAMMVAQYHRASPVATGTDGPAAIKPVVEQLMTALVRDKGHIDPSKAELFGARLESAFASLEQLLAQRAQAGCVRRCHGDLYLGNIVLIDGAPVPFDALEFSERLATIDVLYDLAFLLMDLVFHGDRSAANVVLNAYVGAAPVGREIEGLACLPLFLACRAGVRAAVAIERAAQTSGAAQKEQHNSVRRHADLALSCLEPSAPLLIAVGGLSGTGKSTLAAQLAPLVGPTLGALHVRSDVERKRLFGVAETERLPPEHYRAEVSEQVYACIFKKARRTLRAGHAAIVDAVFAKPSERAAIAAVAHELGCRFIGLWLTAPADILTERVEARRGDASDADRGVVVQQLSYDLGELTWALVDASGTREQSMERATTALRAAGVNLLEAQAQPHP